MIEPPMKFGKLSIYLSIRDVQRRRLFDSSLPLLKTRAVMHLPKEDITQITRSRAVDTLYGGSVLVAFKSDVCLQKILLIPFTLGC